MVQPHEANIDKITQFYDSAQTQSDAVHFIGHLRNYDNTQDEKFLRPEELDVLKGDCSKAKNLLGWKHEYTFETMLDEMIEYLLKEIHG